MGKGGIATTCSLSGCGKQSFQYWKDEGVYLKAYQDGRDARSGIGAYFRFYNTERVPTSPLVTGHQPRYLPQS